MQRRRISKTVQFFQKINQFQWLILLALAPFFLFIQPETSWILLIFPVLWGMRFLAGEKPFLISPVNGLLLLLAVQVLVSLYATYDIAISLPKIAGIALFFCLILCVC